MPVHLPPISRRRFLSGTLAAGASLLLSRDAWGGAALDANRFLLFADTHIPEQRDQRLRGVSSTEALEQAVRQAVALNERPSAALIAGDCAFRQGDSGDYASLGRLVEPLRRLGMSVHFALGNHDHRERFFAAFPDAKRPEPHEASLKHVALLETPHANWFLLDSLDKTNVTPGALGEAQLAWLAKTLDAHPEKPALLLAHHNPDPLTQTRGLVDTAGFLKVIVPRKHVKGYFFGHTHRWSTSEVAGIHLVNVPTTAWVFDAAQPRGFLTASLAADRMMLTLHGLDPAQAKHGQSLELKWRC